VYYVHDVFHGAGRVFIVRKVLRKFGFVVPIFVITVVLPEPYVKWSTCLPYVLLITVRACQMVYAAFFVFFFIDGWSVDITVIYSVLCFGGDIKSSVFENVSNEFCLFTDTCKFGPFWFCVYQF